MVQCSRVGFPVFVSLPSGWPPIDVLFSFVRDSALATWCCWPQCVPATPLPTAVPPKEWLAFLGISILLLWLRYRTLFLDVDSIPTMCRISFLFVLLLLLPLNHACPCSLRESLLSHSSLAKKTIRMNFPPHTHPTMSPSLLSCASCVSCSWTSPACEFKQAEFAAAAMATAAPQKYTSQYWLTIHPIGTAALPCWVARAPCNPQDQHFHRASLAPMAAYRHFLVVFDRSLLAPWDVWD